MTAKRAKPSRAEGVSKPRRGDALAVLSPFQPVQAVRLPHPSRSRKSAPVPARAPFNCAETETIDKPSHFTIEDAWRLTKHTCSKARAEWSRAVQGLPDL